MNVEWKDIFNASWQLKKKIKVELFALDKNLSAINMKQIEIS